MPRIPKDLRKELAQQFLNTKPRQEYVRPYTAIETLDAARHFEPKRYPYENRDRLHRRITDACIDALDQVWKLIGPLPPHYRNEILRQNSVRSFRAHELQKLYEDALSHRAFDPEDARYYSQLLSDAIRAFEMMMPPQFTELIEYQLKPFYLLLESMSEYSRTRKLNDIPELAPPAAPGKGPEKPASENKEN